MARKSEKKDISKLSYAEATAEIEDILTRLRGEQIGIDDLAAEVKRATELIAFCKAQLRDVEATVKAQTTDE